MKKLLLASGFLAFMIAAASAQSSFRILSPSNVDLTNTIYYVYQDTSSIYTGAFNIKNSSGVNITSKLRKEELSMSTGAISSICYSGICCPSFVYTTKCYPHSAGATLAMNADFTYSKSYTSSTIRYTVYNCADLNDSASFIIVYNASPASIKQQSTGFSISEPYPNPASSVLHINYTMSNTAGVHILVYDLLGSIVRSAEIVQTSGIWSLSTEDLRAGMYFYSLEINHKILTTRKFLVNH
jgi:hypothetical protein